MQTWKNRSIIGANEYVVLKQMNDGQLDTVRFLLGKKHRNVVEYLDVRVIDGKAVVIEEFLKGRTLDQIIRSEQREFTEKEILKIGVDICEGLRFLHGLTPPLIHGDIKPENLMYISDTKSRNMISNMDERSHIILLDADDAYIWQDAPVYAKNRGTFGFCAPEQREGKMPDFSWDMYGLGKTLEFLYLGTDNKPHKKALESIINKMTATEAIYRFVTVSECKTVLESCLFHWYGYR